MSRTRLLLVLFGLAEILNSSSSFAQTRTVSELRSSIDEAVASANLPNAWITINVQDATTGTAWYQKDVGRSFIPASNTKLFTTAASLHLLGPDFRYETSVWTDGEVSGGILHGNLIVKGSGDPVIGGRFSDGDLTHTFRSWADSLKGLGITRITGDIIGDDDFFDEDPLGSGWQANYLNDWYAAEIGALSFNDNCVDLTLIAQKENMPTLIEWAPFMTDFIQVDNATRTVEATLGITEDYTRTPGSNHFVVSTLVPEGRRETESLTVRTPTLFFVHILRDVLIQQGIAVSGLPVDIDNLSVKPSYPSSPLFSTFSPPLSEIVSVINKRSQNLYAEQLLRTLGAHFPAEGFVRGSAASGWASTMDFFRSAGLNTERLQLVDGSGLARQNLVTSTMVSQVLRYMFNHPNEDIKKGFLDSLPVGGVDGSLSSRMKGTAAEGNVRAKTGTIGAVSALSGFVSTAERTHLVFSIMVNHYTGSSKSVRNLQDTISTILASHGSH